MNKALVIKASGNHPPKVNGVAYTGGKIELGWNYPVVVDLAGMEIPSQVPILADHTNQTNATVGTATVAVNDNQLYLSGTITGTNPAAKDIVSTAKNGHRWQLSIGAAVVDRKFIPASDAFEANGRTFSGECFHVTKSVLREVSVVAVGADMDTELNIAASLTLEIGDSNDMTKEAVLNTNDIKAERERIQAINKVCDGYPEIAASAIDQGWTPEKAELHVFRTAKIRKEQDTGVKNVYINADSDCGADKTKVLKASLHVMTGTEDMAVNDLGSKTIEIARKHGATNLLDICAQAIKIEGGTVPRDKFSMVKAAASTVTLPNVLGDYARRTLMNSYKAAPSTWDSFCSIRSCADFREHKGIKLNALKPLQKVTDGGSLQHGTLSDGAIPYSVDTFGRLIGLTRKDIINDDVGAFDDTAKAQGSAAMRSLNDHVWETILSNPSSFFHADNSNYLTGTSSALGIESLPVALKKMRTQRDEDNNDLDIEPAVLAVAPELEPTARQLLESQGLNLIGTTTEGTYYREPNGNSMRGLVKLVVEPRIANSAKFSSASNTKWYLFAAPVHTPWIVAFLSGKKHPTVEYFGLDQDVEKLAVQWRVYFDYGTAPGDFRAAVMSDGA